MITIKTEKEIKKLAYGGHLLAEILKQLTKKVRVGIPTIELDISAEELIRKIGGRPSFKNYQNNDDDPPFPTTICASVNDQLVHKPASSQVLHDGDILSIDIGMEYEGLFTDMTVTIPVGKISRATKKLIKVTKKSLDLAIGQVKPGNYIHDISWAVQEYVEDNGFSVVRDLVGHGVGYAVHEDPRIPNFCAPDQPPIELIPGMVLAIEPMVNIGSYRVKTLDDGWTVVTADGKLCAHFEHTVAVTEKGCLILTK
jgi:methionyl aminopeptidase